MPVASRVITSTGRPLGGRPVWSLNEVQEQYLQIVLDKLRAGTYRLEHVPRCLCGGDHAVSIATQDRFGLPVAAVACSDCGLVRTTPRLHDADLPAFYRDDYHGLHMGVPEPDPSMALFRAGQGKRIYELLKDSLRSPARIAEIGCGTGQVMREFQDAAKADGIVVDAVGCEFAPAYVEAGRSVGTFIELGSADVLEPHGPFDLVIMSHVLEHFADPPRELATVSRLLAADGRAYVEVPGIHALHRKPEYNYDLLNYLTVAHTYHFSLVSLTSVMSRAGFERTMGDEEVRAAFKHGDASNLASSSAVGELISYLEWLNVSRAMRSRRLRGRAWRLILAGVRRGLGMRVYEAARRIRRRSRLVR